MEVMWRKSFILDIKKTQANKTFVASKVTSRHILVSFGAISLKLYSFSPFNFIKQKAWHEMLSHFIRNQTYRIFCSFVFPLPYIVISEIGVIFSITHLVCTKYVLYQFSFSLVYCFQGNVDYLIKPLN